MLDSETKRRIDSARDILVGKVPDPKSQVEQITIALIYKFMDDMDAESEEFGGKRKFFANDFANYGWAKLMRSGLGGHETLNLYAEAIAKMPENPGIPPLFRDIFKNAYLPYRDPETLRSFLKIIDEFNYDHSERLGDAFEYLLSVLGSQGDAGQFRTPRHIIDFIVSIIDPKKNESVLDPACGTAGFLISSYKHILQANADANGNSTLTPDEKGRLAQNFRGYDISPDMVRLSLVNMYLHGFPAPHIYEYDTLTSQDRWNEHADVILANPPFMSPKGGIRPHNRFSVQSKRSEVLFVDYMAEHLTPNGRAGIIVPEGIIFQSQNAYKQLRKMLVEDYLIAVISLPAGVFNPYSGVKTSILILDKQLAKKKDGILFLKIDNDGTDLGARRKSTGDSDLPRAVSICRKWIDDGVGRKPELEDGLNGCAPIIVPRSEIANNGEFNLTAERYRNTSINEHMRYPMVKIGDHIEETTEKVRVRALPVWSVSNQLGFVSTDEYFDKQVASADTSNYKVVSPDYFAFNPSRINVGSIALNSTDSVGAVSPMYVVFHISTDGLDKNYLFALLKSGVVNGEINRLAQGSIRIQMRFNDLANLRIPLPPLEVQKEIVAEIEGYQKVIDGARAVIDNYRPYIPVDPDWPVVKVEDICILISGQHIDKEDYNTNGHGIGYLTGPIDFGAKHPVISKWTTSPKAFAENGDILITVKGSGLGKVNLLDIDKVAISRQLMAIRVHDAIPEFIYTLLLSKFSHIQSLGGGAAIPGITRENVLSLEIPLPPLSTQQALVAEIEAEQALVEANRELITRFEKKIQATLARVWGD